VKLRNAKPRDKQWKLYDAHGLYALVHPRGTIYWRYDYRFAGKARTASYGVYPKVSLAEARERHAALRATRRDGLDPAEVKRVAAREAIAATGTTRKLTCRRGAIRIAHNCRPREATRSIPKSLIGGQRRRVGAKPSRRSVEQAPR